MEKNVARNAFNDDDDYLDDGMDDFMWSTSCDHLAACCGGFAIELSVLIVCKDDAFNPKP